MADPTAPTAATPTLAPETPPVMVSIPNMVIASVGQWAVSQGDGTMTRDDLAAAVAASNDPGFRAAPKGKRGHGPQDDEGPGIGRFVNLRLSPDGMDLIADLVGLFVWQKALVMAGFTSRSVEAYRGLQSTATGRTYSFVITAVALLGVEWPAVAVLDDLEAWASDSGPDSIHELVAASVRLTSDDDGQGTEENVGDTPDAPLVKAAANMDQVRRDFITWADAAGRYSWWIRELWLDPDTVIVDDDQGNLWRVPFTVGDSTVTFGDPTAVQVSYVDANPASAPQPVAASRPSFAQVYANRSESRPAKNENEQEGTMDTQAIIATYGLPADTTDEQAQAAHTAATAAAAAVLGGNADGDGDGGDTTDTDEPTGDATERTPEPVAASTGFKVNAKGELELPAGTMLVSEAKWNENQAVIDRVASEQVKATKARRDELVKAAVSTGRITAAERDQYRKDLDDAPEVTERILARLAPSKAMPVGAEVGSNVDGSDADDGSDEYPAAWKAAKPSVEIRKG